LTRNDLDISLERIQTASHIESFTTALYRLFRFDKALKDEALIARKTPYVELLSARKIVGTKGTMRHSTASSKILSRASE
jgi:hypothetical protein